MDDYCRICLFKVEYSECVNIFTESRNNELLSQMLINFASIVVCESDHLPRFACLINCLDKLYSSHDFKNLVVTSDSVLKKRQKLMDTGVINFGTPLFVKHGEENFSCTGSNSVTKEEDAIEISKVEVENRIKNYMNKNKTRGKITKFKPKNYRCTVCQETFKNSYRVAVHKATHTGTFAYSCEICSKGFPTKYLVNVHKHIHFGERPFKCEDCDKSFKSPASLLIHKKVHLVIRPYQCKTCGRQFVQLGGLKTHELTHTNEKLFICEFCSKSFTQNSYFAKHLKTHNKSRLPCPICGKTYARLKSHLKCHGDDKTKNFSCEICNKKFTLKNSLNIHMRIHNGVKPYSCSICDARFTQSTCLVRHMRTHTGETPYPCNYCDLRFSFTHHRLKHTKKEHLHEDSV